MKDNVSAIVVRMVREWRFEGGEQVDPIFDWCEGEDIHDALPLILMEDAAAALDGATWEIDIVEREDWSP